MSSKLAKKKTAVPKVKSTRVKPIKAAAPASGCPLAVKPKATINGCPIPMPNRANITDFFKRHNYLRRFTKLAVGVTLLDTFILRE